MTTTTATTTTTAATTATTTATVSLRSPTQHGVVVMALSRARIDVGQCGGWSPADKLANLHLLQQPRPVSEFDALGMSGHRIIAQLLEFLKYLS